MPEDVSDLTDRELYALEFVLRKIADREKSRLGLALASDLCREIRMRAARVVHSAADGRRPDERR